MMQFGRSGLVRRLAFFALAVGLLECIAPRLGYAHGTAPPDLFVWGPFGRGTARCLRSLSVASRRCFEKVLAVQGDCIERRLSGQLCDDTAREALIVAAYTEARGVVTDVCTGGQLTELRYSGFPDAQTDIQNACILEVDAVLSLLYPINATGTDPEMRQCLTRTAALGRKLVRHVLADVAGALDRIAVRIAGPSVKIALMNASRTRVTRAKLECAASLQRDCPAFETIYGRSAASWVDALVRRDECLLLATYFQTAISCPQRVCGNGVRELGEGCDDGNQIANDRCSNSCGLN